MQLTFLIVLCTLLNVDCRKSRTQQVRIIGGRTVSITNFPFIGALVVKPADDYNDILFAGGCSIIAPKWAVTAAHCVIEIQREIKYGRAFVRSNSSMWLSINNTSVKISEHLILEGIMHEKFDALTDDFDLAVLRVKQEFVGKYEHAIALPEENYKLKGGTTAIVLGWGMTITDSEPFTVQELKAAQVIITNSRTCREKFSNTTEMITSRMLCAGAPGIDACVNDSGGPLVQNRTLIGIVSWGLECASDLHPGVYTKITELTKWIRRNIEEKY